MKKWLNTYDGLWPLVAGGFVADEVRGLSPPQNIDDDDCGDGVGCWKIPPHAAVEWPEELACVCCGCCCGGGGGCFGSCWNKI